MTDHERAARMLQLATEINRRQAGEEFAQFVGYINKQYRAEWFHRHIAAHCQKLLNGEIKNLMLFVPPQHGKALPANTPILTPNGWKKHGDLQSGDIVFGQDGRRKRVIANSGTYEWPITRVTFQNGQQICCAPEHLWRIKYEQDNGKGRTEEVMETREIFCGKINHRRSPYIDCAPALEMDAKPLPIDPYVLGIWLGDGSGRWGAITKGKRDMEWFSRFGYIKTDKGGSAFRLQAEGLTAKLRKAGLLRKKHIPTEYLTASAEQRTQLLCGLMDTNGTCDTRGNCEFTQKSGRLAEDTYTLIRSLGYKARKSYARATIGGRDVGEKTRILFSPDRDDKVFTLPRKAARLKGKTTQDRNDKKKFFIRSAEPAGRAIVNCIQVEGGMYLAGEHLIPTHNSEIVSRLFPAFALGRNPALKIAGCSYSADLAGQFSRAIQRIMDTDEYRAIFPHSLLGGAGTAGYVRNADFFETAGAGGFYKAVGVSGPLTGTPVDIAIIDDPVKDATEAYSAVYRERVWNWYNSVLTTRLHNRSRQIFIMTRWHEDDLAGRILKAEPQDWHVITIPAICEERGDGGISRREVGDPLWPSRHSLTKLQKQQARSPREFAALYQQRPTIDGGNIVKREWFQHLTPQEFAAMRFREPIHFYLDTAYNKRKQGADNDPSGILAACRVRNNIYILHAQKAWMGMPELLRFLPQYMDNHGATAESRLNIEPKANGISVVQMLRESTTLNVRHTPTPTEDKEVRFRVVSPRIECGRVFLVDGAWTEDFLQEVCAFPAAAHDEFVDILGYAINDLIKEDEEIDYDTITKANFGL